MTRAPELERNRVVAVRRLLYAPRTFLFQAWTDPARFGRWFGPKGWTIERCEVDARVGGAWRAWFKTGKGAGVCVGGVYTEVEPDRRIVFTWDTSPQGGAPDSVSIVTVEFRDEADGVEISITHRELATGQAVDMEVGWNNTFDSLEQYVAAEAGHWPVSASKENKR
jgi:uncharacterized protein YndB with AHSA1/START domain